MDDMKWAFKDINAPEEVMAAAMPLVRWMMDNGHPLFGFGIGEEGGEQASIAIALSPLAGFHKAWNKAFVGAILRKKGDADFIDDLCAAIRDVHNAPDQKPPASPTTEPGTN